MEQKTPQNHPQTTDDHSLAMNSNDNKATSNNGNANNGGFLCRQSSTRWTPTTDQIRILKELYYTNGMRSPTAEQIQRISARLRQYGKIEGKNVFYWFQNHKARERQKKRFTSDHSLHNHGNNSLNVVQRNSVTMTSTTSAWKPHDHVQDYQAFHHGHLMKCSNLSPVVSGENPSSASMVGVNGQMGNNPYGFGGVTNMEKAFREQCGSSGVNGGSIAHTFGWTGSSLDPYPSPHEFFDRRSTFPPEGDGGDDDDDHGEDQASPEIETLPLFPMHGEKINGRFSGDGGYYSGWCGSNGGGGGRAGSRASLELSLSSYGHHRSPDSL